MKASRVLLKVFISVAAIALVVQCAAQEQSEQICVTRTGEKYHRCNCRYVADDKREITLEAAIKQNYQPCKVCKPAVNNAPLIAPLVQSDSVPAGNSLKEKAAVAPTQCVALTKAGTRCKRNATEGNDRCWQHKE